MSQRPTGGWIEQLVFEVDGSKGVGVREAEGGFGAVVRGEGEVGEEEAFSSGEGTRRRGGLRRRGGGEGSVVVDGMSAGRRWGPEGGCERRGGR